MSNLSTLPKGDSAWLFRKALERIIQQISVLETNIGASTTGNSANTQVIFNDNGVLRGDPDFIFNAALNKLVALNIESTASLVVGTTATITGDLTVKTNVLKVDSTNNRVGIGTASPDSLLQMAGAGTVNWKLSNTADSVVVGSYAGTTSATIGTVSNHPFSLFTNNTVKATIDSSGRVGIGTVSPGETCTVNGAIGLQRSGTQYWHYGVNASNALVFTRSTVADRMTLDSDGNLGLGVTPSAWAAYKAIQVGRGSFSSDTSSSTSVSTLFGSNFVYDGNWKYIVGAAATFYQQDSGQHRWFNESGTKVAGATFTPTQAMTLDASGNLLVGVTSANASGGVLQLKSGITFPATQVASSDANTLDDYEEGTFTPTIIGTTTDGTGTYSVQNGVYTKIGNLVTVQMYLVWSAHTGTGNMQISGLPFVSSGAANVFSAVSAGLLNNIALTAGNVFNGYVINGSSNISLEQYPTGGGASTRIPIDTSAELIITASYRV